MAEYMAGRGTTALGIIGTVLGGIGTAAAGGLNLGANAAVCSDDHCVNRYEAQQQARIAELETEVKLRDANTYTLGEMGKLRDYVDSRFRCVESQLTQQAVINAQTVANISCMQKDITTLMGLTKTVIPITNVCPQPMQRFNTWVAPTGTADEVNAAGG